MGAGRPSKFKDDYIRQAKILGNKGFTDQDIAELFDVKKQTVNNWKKQYPEFFASLKKGKEISDANVVRSLYQRATGYSHPDVHISNFQGTVTKTPIIKHYPPDVGACFGWLYNRRPDEWKRGRESESTGNHEDKLNQIANALDRLDTTSD